MSLHSSKFTGFAELRRLYRDSPIACQSGETKWFFSAGREFGLWSLTAHGFGLHFSIIGPFKLIRQEVR